MTTGVTVMPKCTVCGGEVTDIGPLDVPYHIECVMAAWDRVLRPLDTLEDEFELDLELVPVPVLRVPPPWQAGRSDRR
jgi:hypothetical protein